MKDTILREIDDEAEDRPLERKPDVDNPYLVLFRLVEGWLMFNSKRMKRRRGRESLRRSF